MAQQTRYVFLLKYILPAIDFLMFNIVYSLAIVFGEHYSHVQYIDINNNHIIVSNLIWLLCAAFFNMYSVLDEKKLENIYRATWKSIACHFVLFILYLLLHQKGHFFLSFICWFYSMLTISFILNRLAGTAMHYKVFIKYTAPKSVAVIGSNPTTLKLIAHFEQESNISFYGSVGGDEIICLDMGKLIEIGVSKKLAEAVLAGVSDLLVTLMPNNISDAKGLLELADNHGLRVKFIPDLGMLQYGDFNVSYLGNKFPILTIRDEPLEEISGRFKKRLFDLLFSGMITVTILWWLLPLIAILIKLDSKGPVFFLQKRNGRNNKPFRVFKFRTMKVASTDEEFVQAVKNDVRVTNVGGFLRKTSLDEFPQFINVLLGEMSVVGPRPHPLLLNKQFYEIINKYMVRHFVKPGITGWAQVHGLRGETKDIIDMENRIKYDIFYLENWSAMLDVKIVFLTVINMIRGEDNAY